MAKTYKTQLGAIPKIVNNFKPKTSNQNTFYNIIGDDNSPGKNPNLSSLPTSTVGLIIISLLYGVPRLRTSCKAL